MDDTVSFSCPSCGVTLKAPSSAAGRRLACRQCGKPITVPALFDETPKRQPVLMAPLPAAAPAASASSPQARPVPKHLLIGAGAAVAIIGVAILMLSGGKTPPTPPPPTTPVPTVAAATPAPVAAPAPPTPSAEQQALEALRKERERLKAENEALRKAATTPAPKPAAAAPAVPATPTPAPVAASRPEAAKTAEPTRGVIADLVERCAPQVVTITTDQESSGSGFVAFEEKLVVTNFHVVSGGTDFTLHFPRAGGAVTAAGTVIAVDADNDLALLSIQDEPAGTAALPLGDERRLRAGVEVVAIGSPGMGSTLLTSTVSNGIISSTDRELDGKRFLQTTAPINPGNSGGPLFDLNGTVIGVITAKARRQEGVAFAVPVGLVRRLYQERDGSCKITGEFADWERKQPFRALKKNPGAIPIEGISPSLAFDTQTGLLVALAPERNKVLIIDTAKRAITKELFAGTDPIEVHATNRGTAWVAFASSKTMALIDIASGRVQRTVTLQHEPVTFAITGQYLWFVEKGGRLAVVPTMGDKPSRLTPFEARSVTATGMSNNVLCGSPKSWLFEVNGDRLLRFLARDQVLDKAVEEFNRHVDQRNAAAASRERRELILKEMDKAKGLFDDSIKFHNQPAGVDVDFQTTTQALFIDQINRLVYFNRCAMKAGDPSRILGVFKKPDHRLSESPELEELAEKFPWFNQIIAASPDGSLVTSGTHLFDTADFTVREELPIPTPAAVFAPDGRTLWLADIVNQQLLGLPIKAKDAKTAEKPTKK